MEVLPSRRTLDALMHGALISGRFAYNPLKEPDGTVQGPAQTDSHPQAVHSNLGDHPEEYV